MKGTFLCCRINRTDNPNVSVWGIFNQFTINCHICNTVCKHASFMEKKHGQKKKQYLSTLTLFLKNPLCHTFLRKCIFIRLSHSDKSVNTPENVSLTIHYNYYLGVLMILQVLFKPMMLADKLYPKSNISLHKKNITISNMKSDFPSETEISVSSLFYYHLFAITFKNPFFCRDKSFKTV